MRWWDDESGYEKYANHDGIKRALDGEWLGEYILRLPSMHEKHKIFCL